jgi:hypothetical protein
VIASSIRPYDLGQFQPEKELEAVDIESVGILTLPKICGQVPCGQCESCVLHVMRNAAAYSLRVGKQEEADPKAVLLDLLERLGLPS